ncbi:c-type cytochrome [Pedobacter xixiisoli]|uniref:Cytochrome c, mono- and diheme variants n=1 Tax=Pedobacter xixiisoli TaxID=1476464 RepID=A0A285ZUE0_9SPHI|nr:cytochrome c [Pedobacter xixiisoli]SOD13246.1 Cytochrome c, mono- and diheme variants [Pedobacter xixiisoli]
MKSQKSKVKSYVLRKAIVYGVFLGTIAIVINACQSASEIEMAKYLSNGKDIYQARCQNCHGEKGEGLGELAPPLTDTVFLKLNKQKLACYIKNGVNEPMEIHGKTYHEKMPAFKDLHDIDIAQVTVYITNSFGNKQGMYTYEQVANDLKNCN